MALNLNLGWNMIQFKFQRSQGIKNQYIFEFKLHTVCKNVDWFAKVETFSFNGFVIRLNLAEFFIFLLKDDDDFCDLIELGLHFPPERWRPQFS